MYRLLWRVIHEATGRTLLEDAADDDVIAIRRMVKAVDRASHKMKAFVRFRELAAQDGPRYIARFEPEHDVLARTAPFFADRFGTMVWTIVTPDGVAHWDRECLRILDADPNATPPDHDDAEALWLTYYASIFNPARLNLPMMRKEMPKAYWKHLPEAAAIPALVAEAMPRMERMISTHGDVERSAWAPVGPIPDAPGGAAALEDCRRCALWQRATQPVPGRGPGNAALMLVGEQPGDEEDLAGQPFVGPAGALLRRALEQAGVPVAGVYITNAVKHFSFVPRGKRRIHKTPAQHEIDACRHWLDHEIAQVCPTVIVALGASALYALSGRHLGVGAARGQPLARAATGTRIVATYHPAAVLREQEAPTKNTRYEALVADLRQAGRLARL